MGFMENNRRGYAFQRRARILLFVNKKKQKNFDPSSFGYHGLVSFIPSGLPRE
jgi:hypothetical protein